MSVALDALGTVQQFNATAGATGVSFTGITVGSGANRALVVGIAFDTFAGVSPVVVWDSGGSNQSMTQIGTAANVGGSTVLVYLFGLVNPVAGNKTLKVTWTGTFSGYVDSISWTGADQTGGSTTFANPQTASVSASPIAVTTTGTASDASAAIFGASSGCHRTASTATSWFANSSGPSGNAYGDYLTGVGSISDTTDGSHIGAMVGCTIVAAGAAGGGFLSRHYYDMPAGNRMG